MFKKFVMKAVLGAAVAGSALASSLVASPAVVSSAPEILHVACYPGSVATTTTLSVAEPIVRHGHGSAATVRVSRTDSGSVVRRGVVTFTLTNPDRSERRTWRLALDRRGEARVSLPKRLPGGATYGLRVAYDARGCRNGGSSASRGFTVLPARASTGATGPDRSSGERSIIDVRGTSEGSAATRIRARVQVHLVRSRLLRFVRLGTGYFVGSTGPDDLRASGF